MIKARKKRSALDKLIKKILKFNNRKKNILYFLGISFFLWLAFEYFTLPNGVEFLNKNPTETPIMQHRISEAEADGRKIKILHDWVSISEVPPSLLKLIVVGEDFSFFSHDGFDYGEIGIVLSNLFTELRAPRGASTITQQLARNLYLSQSRSPIRKIKEAIITSRLESKLSKKRILELYINVIELGDGIFGVAAASKYYFNKSVHSISLNEAATLAAIIPAPVTTYNLRSQLVRVNKRKAILLKRMNKLNLPPGVR